MNLNFLPYKKLESTLIYWKILYPLWRKHFNKLNLSDEEIISILLSNEIKSIEEFFYEST